MPFSDYVMDKHIAPEMSKFVSADVPDMSAVDAEQEHWLANFILNITLRVDVRSPQKQQLFNFLRRSHSAFTEYGRARESTLTFLRDRERSLQYLDAIGHWEAFLAYSWQACCFLVPGKARLFEKGDGSILQRLNALHNRAKHADQAIQRGDFSGDSPLCVWLRNDGLCSTDASLTFDEAAEVLADLAAWSSAVQDPLTMHDKIRVLAEGGHGAA